MKSGNLNFLKPSGPLQASNGTALPFTAELNGYYGRKEGINFFVAALYTFVMYL